MRSLVVQATRDRGYAIIDGQPQLATLRILALAVLAKPNRIAEDVSESGERKQDWRGWRATDLDGRAREATIEDVLLGNPSEGDGS
jgi:hypothetical protein